MIRWSCIAFSDLPAGLLYEVLRLRQLVFAVEQNCVYLDCDRKDGASHHLIGQDNAAEVVAYARLVPPGIVYAEPSIGRVVCHPSVRRNGVGKEVMRESLVRIESLFGAHDIRIGAQHYLQKFYEQFGFEVVTSPYDEDGIAHVEMMRRHAKGVSLP